MCYKLFYIKPITVEQTTVDFTVTAKVDIVVCAKNKTDAAKLIKEHFIDEVKHSFHKKEETIFDQKKLNSAKIFEVKSHNDVPYKWQNSIPWGLPDEFNDFSCCDFMNQMESEKQYHPLIGKKIVKMYQSYNSLIIDFDDGSSIYIDDKENAEVNIKEKR
jgi:hypothetical protein